LILISPIAGKAIFIAILRAFALAGHLKHTIQPCPTFFIVEAKVFSDTGIQSME
jgi:hypothetical protein